MRGTAGAARSAGSAAALTVPSCASALAISSTINHVAEKRIGSAVSHAAPGDFATVSGTRNAARFEGELMVHTPLLAYHDPQFIDSDDGRPIRIVSEYLSPLSLIPQCRGERYGRVLRLGAHPLGGPLGRYYDEACELGAARDRLESEQCGGRLIVCPEAALASWKRPIGGPTSPAAAASVSTSVCRTSSVPTASSARSCASSSTTSSCASSGSPTSRTRSSPSRGLRHLR